MVVDEPPEGVQTVVESPPKRKSCTRPSKLPKMRPRRILKRRTFVSRSNTILTRVRTSCVDEPHSDDDDDGASSCGGGSEEVLLPLHPPTACSAVRTCVVVSHTMSFLCVTVSFRYHFSGGDEHKFKEINAAYEILSDPEKRAKYDKYGLEGVDDDAGAQARGEDLFSMFFGGGGRRGGGRSGPRKGPSVNHPIKVSLEDLYNGKTVKLAINRKVIVGQVTECTACNGQGARLEIRQIAPGMITQMQRQCDRCDGQGKIAETKSERKVLEVHIEKGMSNGERIVFRNHADEVPGMEAGDVNFVIQEKPHELFKRKGADLLATRDISLNQALCGFSVRIVLKNTPPSAPPFVPSRYSNKPRAIF